MLYKCTVRAGTGCDGGGIVHRHSLTPLSPSSSPSPSLSPSPSPSPSLLPSLSPSRSAVTLLHKLYTLTMCDIAMNDSPILRTLKSAIVKELLPLMATTYECTPLKMKVLASQVYIIKRYIYMILLSAPSYSRLGALPSTR